MPSFLRDLLRAFLLASLIPGIVLTVALAVYVYDHAVADYELWRAHHAALQAEQRPMVERALQLQQREQAAYRSWAAQHSTEPPINFFLQPQAAPSAQLVATAPDSVSALLPVRKPPPPSCAVEFFLPEVMFSTLSPADVAAVVRTACPST